MCIYETLVSKKKQNLEYQSKIELVMYVNRNVVPVCCRIFHFGIPSLSQNDSIF